MGCDLQVVVFLYLLLFWCTKQQWPRNNHYTPCSHHTPRSYHTPTLHHLPHTRHSAGTVWSRSPREGWGSDNGTRVFPPFSPSYCLPRSDSRPTPARIPAQLPVLGMGEGRSEPGVKGEKRGGGSFWGNDFPGSVPKLTPSFPERGGVKEKRDGTPPSRRYNILPH